MGDYKKKLPIGVENFEELRHENFYYVDKTYMIRDILRHLSKVTLFTRPRRFGKSLNMSMLENFFSVEGDKSIFQGLDISLETELCEKYMGKYPVISFSLKNLDAAKDYKEAQELMALLIQGAAGKVQYLLDSERLTEADKRLYSRFLYNEMNDGELLSSLRILSELLEKHHGQKVIVLIDEYDVPLAKAFEKGYYDQMVNMIRGVMGQVLKTNNSLKLAILTGCMRISKESIFTGLNNFTVLSCPDVEFDEYFGFTDEEVKEMLKYFNLSQHYDTVKEWYDGYLFGKQAVYCPWDVISYCKNLCADSSAMPEDYWSNTSSNSIVRRFIDKSGKQTKEEIERLIAGEAIVKEIKQELTYNELDKSIDHLWSVLFTTGYLTKRKRVDSRKYELMIPNREIRELFILQIQEWFADTAAADTNKLDELCRAFPEGNAEVIEKLFNDYLWNTISIRDTASAKEWKENFYHGILLGLLGHMGNWLVKSNEESGEGYSDILIEVPESRTGIVIEMKYAEEGRLEYACRAALQQIEERKYSARLISDGMTSIVKYGIACYKKHCRVLKGEE